MSEQVSDSFYFNNKKFYLIDIENGKSIIKTGNFKYPPLTTYIASTDCYRGYIAEYFIQDYILFGKSKYYGEEKFTNKTWCYYTGSCIIAYSRNIFFNSDFLECYLDADEAFELYFENGILMEVNNLNQAILKYKIFPDLKENIAKEFLKYDYDEKTYKWRE